MNCARGGGGGRQVLICTFFDLHTDRRPDFYRTDNQTKKKGFPFLVLIRSSVEHGDIVAHSIGVRN